LTDGHRNYTTLTDCAVDAATLRAIAIVLEGFLSACPLRFSRTVVELSGKLLANADQRELTQIA